MAEPLFGTEQAATETPSRHKKIPSSRRSNTKIYTAARPHRPSTNRQRTRERDAKHSHHPAADSKPTQISEKSKAYRAPQNLNPVRRPTRRSDTVEVNTHRRRACRLGHRVTSQHRNTSTNGQRENRAHQIATSTSGERAAHNINLRALLLINKWVLISTILLCDSTHHHVSPAILSSTLLPPSYTLTQSPPKIWPLSLHSIASTHYPLNTHTHRLNTQTLDRSSPPHREYLPRHTGSEIPALTPPPARTSTPSPTTNKHNSQLKRVTQRQGTEPGHTPNIQHPPTYTKTQKTPRSAAMNPPKTAPPTQTPTHSQEQKKTLTKTSRELHPK